VRRAARSSPRASGTGVLSIVKRPSDRRTRLVPGQSLTLRLPDPGADAYVIVSVGGTVCSDQAGCDTIFCGSQVAASVKNRLTLRESTEVVRGQADL